MLRLRRLLSSSAIRLALTSALTFTVSTCLLFAFIYWRTGVVEMRRIDTELVRDAQVMASQSAGELRESIRVRAALDIHRITVAALFGGDSHRIEGNLDRLPEGLTVDGRAHRTDIDLPGSGGPRETVVVVGRQVAGGAILVLGRSIDSLTTLHGVVIRALELAILPTLLLSLAAGAIMSGHARSQIRAVHLASERIIQGDLHGRLMLHGNGDDFDHLATAINFMLDEIARLLGQAQSTADNIAHDLRTPLTRVRTRLERARQTAQTHADLADSVDHAIIGLDQALNVITSLLRIGHVERGHRRANFVEVDLDAIVQEIADLFEPFAEEKGLRIQVDTVGEAVVHADRDLMSEAIANLVDNAVKFTPAGGTVTLGLKWCGRTPAVVVADTGPGIPPEERAAVMRRFYRSDHSRHIEGCGLGLALVDAVVSLHGFQLAIHDANPGCVFEMICGGGAITPVTPASAASGGHTPARK